MNDTLNPTLTITPPFTPAMGDVRALFAFAKPAYQANGWKLNEQPSAQCIRSWAKGEAIDPYNVNDALHAMAFRTLISLEISSEDRKKAAHTLVRLGGVLNANSNNEEVNFTPNAAEETLRIVKQDLAFGDELFENHEELLAELTASARSYPHLNELLS